MDRETVLKLLEEAEAELARAQADRADAHQRAETYGVTVTGLRGVLELLDRSSGARVEPVPVASPIPTQVDSFVKPREAIIRLLDEDPHQELAPSSVEATMRERGWLDPSLSRPVEAIRAAMNRLVDVEKRLEREGRIYRLPKVSVNGSGGGTSLEGIL